MRFLALSLLIPAVAGAALAAQPTPGADQRPRPDFAQMRAHFAEIRQKRADDIALLIGLRPDQRPALDAMLNAMEPPHRMGGPEGKPEDRGPPPGGPDSADAGFLGHLDAMSAHMDKADARAKQGIAAARAFYTGLDADQKRRFEALDELRRTDMGHGGPRGMKGGHGPDGGHDGPPPPPPGN